MLQIRYGTTVCLAQAPSPTQ